MLGTGLGLAEDTRPPYLECGNEKCTQLVDAEGKLYTYLIPPKIYVDMTTNKILTEVETYQMTWPQIYQGFSIIVQREAYESAPPQIKKFIKMPRHLWVEFKVPKLAPYHMAAVCSAVYAEDQRGKKFYSTYECTHVISK